MLSEDGQELKLKVDIKFNIDTDGFQKQIEEASRLAMRDIVVDVTQGAIIDSPKKTGNNMRSLAGEVSGMGIVADGGEAAPERVVDDSKIEGAVYSTSGYGGYLETGTYKMAARPYIKPNVDRFFTEENFAENARRYL